MWAWLQQVVCEVAGAWERGEERLQRAIQISGASIDIVQRFARRACWRTVWTGAARPAARAEAARCARDDRDAAGEVLATAKPTAKKRTKGDKIEEEDDDEKRGGRERCERRDLHLLQSTQPLFTPRAFVLCECCCEHTEAPRLLHGVGARSAWQ